MNQPTTTCTTCPMNTYLLITGNFADGFEFYGPFDDTYFAADFADMRGFRDCSIVKLNAPYVPDEESDQ